MLDTLTDAGLDSLKLLPFLYITYLVMEYIENNASGVSNAAVGAAGRLAPVVGSVLGAVPQCGFCAAAASLYAGSVITPGTLIAIFLSASDEMLPIFISEQVSASFIFKILGMKICIGAAAGLAVDFVYYNCLKKEKKQIDIHHICEHDHCHCHDHASGTGKVGDIFLPALKHTLSVFVFIFVISAAINILLFFAGEDSLKQLITGRPFIAEALAGLAGLIPNCASSVAITSLYLEGVISFYAMLSGLLVGSGVGILVLFRTNENRKENLIITAVLYGIGVGTGCLLELWSGFAI